MVWMVPPNPETRRPRATLLTPTELFGKQADLTEFFAAPRERGIAPRWPYAEVQELEVRRRATSRKGRNCGGRDTPQAAEICGMGCGTLRPRSENAKQNRRLASLHGGEASAQPPEPAPPPRARAG